MNVTLHPHPRLLGLRGWRIRSVYWSVPNVLECSCVTGEYSMLMKVAFHSPMELDIFIGQLHSSTFGTDSANA